MGCICSANGDTVPGSGASLVAQPKAPILLFYLPGNVKDVLTKFVSNYMMGSETTQNNSRLNIRFVDVPNQRSVRRQWQKEYTNKPDSALALYLADIRERSLMLLNVKTLNWFSKQIGSKGSFTVVVICSNDLEVSTFLSLLSPKDLEMVILNEGNPECVFKFVDILTVAVSRFNDSRLRNIEASSRHQRHGF